MPRPSLVATVAALTLGSLLHLGCGEPTTDDNIVVVSPPAEEAPAPVETGPTPQRFATAGEALAALSDPGSQHFLFYLHGAIVEGSDGRPSHPERGTYEYDKILTTLEAAEVTVLSEIRPADTDVGAYAEMVADQVRELLDAGVDPFQIAVVGFSKGGNIALRVSDRLANDDLAFVILGACGPWLESTPLALRGRMLSIFEASDPVASSCRPAVDRSDSEPFFHEIETEMGGGHGAFFRPQPDWIDETLLWSNAPGLRDQLQPPERLEVDVVG